GPLDDQARRLARQASDRLATAGSRAHTRHDMRAVVNLLGRAEALLDPSDPARLALLPDLSEALWEGGRTDEATALTSEFRTLAEDLGDPELIAYATLSGWWLLGELARPLDRARSDAQDAIRVFEASGDERGLARAWQAIASIEWDLGQAGKQLDALEHALDHAGRARASYETEEALFSVTSAIVRGPIPVPEAIARAEGIIGEFPDNRGMEAYMGHALAHLRARLGAFDAAREEVDRYRGFLLDTGQLNAYWRAAEVGFDVEMLADDVQAAADVAEEAHAKMSERGDRWPYLCAFLAQARFALGKYSEASEAADVAASSANSIERALGLGVLARIRASKKEASAAQEMIEEAVGIVERTDFLFDRGTVHLDHAAVMELLGRDEEARAARERALEMFEEKGDLVSASRTR